MSQRLAPEASEDRFRKFSAELLAAEEVGFRDGFFYSPDALSKILERFCNIIAENLHVQSCTVQLKLYDSANSPLLRQLLDSSGKVLQDEELAKPPNAASDDALWQSFSAQCRKRYRQVVGDESRSTIDQIKFRQELLKEAMIFPYALYPKGALWLVASNRKGPWARCSPWLISDINRGIMTQIIQDKAARVRDRMSLRQTRSHRKLGPMDPYIWTNRPSEDQPSPLYFFNYYGVPIRIHQRGDVIGILKVENKGLGAIKEESLTASNAVIHEELATVLKIQLGDTIDIDGFADRLLEDFRACRDRIIDDEEFVPQDISLFSVVYLAHDLAATEHSSDQTIGNFCTLSYPPSGAGDSSAGKRPPVQITFDNSEKEKVFIDWLAQTSDSRFKVVKKFYSSLKAALTELKASKVADEIQVALQATIADMTGVNIPADQLSLARIGPLLYSVQVDVPNKARYFFYLQVSPMLPELKEPDYWEFTEETAERYRSVNDSGFIPGPEDWEFHLPTDRLAARIEALTSAFPIPKFTVSDAWWLSWAALEIGKLIERQISYRGTNLSPTVPLTAMDFFRVPISDLSFVDALRSQYKAATTVKRMLEYHIPNHCRELDLEVTLEHNCRVKDFRSYLERLGQEHRAHYDALIATWLYILYLKLNDRKEKSPTEILAKHKEKCNDNYLHRGLAKYFSNMAHCEGLYKQTEALLGNLREFEAAVNAVCECKDVLFTEGEVSWLRKDASKVFGDLKFASPNLEFGEQTEAARDLVLNNIRNSPQAIKTPTRNPHENQQMDKSEIAEYIYRWYDPFITQAISLYILLNNAIDQSEAGQGYISFYKKGRELNALLREKLEFSHRLNEQWHDTPELISATKRLIDELGKLRAKVSELSTTDFSSVMDTMVADLDSNENTKPESDVRLTLKGIYKRVRTLINIAGNQVCPSLLNWETSRFDYVGARINCLFKNQVFAIYEHLWNRGDPFSHWTSEKQKQDNGNQQSMRSDRPLPQGADVPSKDAWARQRWLSIQTKIHKGENGYNAWQISALMDPRSVLKGYWGTTLYNINVLRDYLVSAIDRWHKEAADKYRDIATQRSEWQDDYCRWFTRGYVTHVLRKDPPARDVEHGQDVYFPEYLLRTPLDIFIRLLETDLVNEKHYEAILDSLLKFIEQYLAKADPNELSPIAQEIYKEAETLARADYSSKKVNQQLSLLELKELENALLGQCPVLTQEATRFNDTTKWPDCQAFQDETLWARLQDLKNVLKSTDRATEIWRKGLRHVLIDLQSSQKQYLFNIKDIRNSENVLDRILCYVLLFDPKSGGDNFSGWTAYDLFYYVSSLIPAELQVRTALADTMAEQYHGVYKSNVDAADSVAVQLGRLQEMGRKLDDLDRETEAIYDGYIVHSMLHARSLKPRRNDQNDN